MKYELNSKQRNLSVPRKQRGFSLVEAMVGFLILSTGMLGIASLQAISLKAGKTSVYTSVVVMKVEELFESMRANPGALTSYGGGAVNNLCTGVKECGPAELAADDLYWWQENLKAGMPSSVSSAVNITAPIAPSRLGEAEVTITWDERDKKEGGSITRSYTARTSICTEIPC